MFDKIVHPVLEDGEERLEKRTDEEIEAENYVLNKVMVRPSISIFTVIKWGVVFFSAVFGLTGFLFCLLKRYLKEILVFVQGELDGNPERLFWGLGIFSFIFMSLCFSKTFLIGLVHLYQRFSPEEKRRSCLFKPTCSEYAILALNKYGVIRGLPKIVDRCRRCHGNKYRIDYP